MIMNIKQRKIQIEPKTKLNYNICCDVMPCHEKLSAHTKKEILIHTDRGLVLAVALTLLDST